MITRRLALQTIRVLVVTIGLDALLWGALLILPHYSMVPPASVLVELFAHAYALWTFGGIYIFSGLCLLTGVTFENKLLVRTGLMTFALLGIYRTMGAFLLHGLLPAIWPSTFALAIIAGALWLTYGQIER